MSLWENSLVAAYQGKGKRKVDHQRTRVVTSAFSFVSFSAKTDDAVTFSFSYSAQAKMSVSGTVSFRPKMKNTVSVGL